MEEVIDVFVSRGQGGVAIWVEGNWYPTTIKITETTLSTAAAAVEAHRKGTLVAAPEALVEAAGYQKPENLLAIFRVPAKIIES